MNKLIFRKNGQQNKNIFRNIPHQNVFQNKPVSEYNIQIPANIFQTWESKRLPPLMYNAVKKIRRYNPRFNYHIYDDNECREFIKNNFDNEVLNAYDNLIPGAYKADLWRYCILYKKGGIYLDIKYIPINGFRFVNLLEKEHFVLDFGEGKGIYNALMVCKPGNEILLRAIKQIVINVNNRFYGNDCLEPTGPKLLSNFFSDQEKKSFDLKHILHGLKDYDKYILFNGHPVLKCYPGYNSERGRFSSLPHYSDLWGKRQIYR
jgi:mannosyltransferase OCH1-like enzyme